MFIRISELTDAGPIVGPELLEISRAGIKRGPATTIAAIAADSSINDSASGFISAGFAAGDSVRVQGFVTGANNVFTARISTIAAGKIVLAGVSLVNETAGASVTVTRWESGRAPSSFVTGVRTFSTLGVYAVNDMVSHGGRIYSCITPNGPGAFNAAHWTTLRMATDPIQLLDGTVGTPAWAFALEPNTGMFRESAGILSVAIQGVKAGQWSGAGFVTKAGTAAAPGLSFLDDSNTGIASGGADIIYFVTGGVIRGEFDATPGLLIGDSAVDAGTNSIGTYNRPRLETTATTQYGLFENTQFGPTSANGYGLNVTSRFANGAPTYTTSLWAGVRIAAPVLGTGQTLSNARGIFITDLPGTTTQTSGVYSQMAAGTGKWFLYGQGSAPSYMLGNLSIGPGSDVSNVASALVVTKTAASGQTANAAQNSLVLDSTASTGISILGPPTSSQQGLRFGDTDNPSMGGLLYSHVTDTLALSAGGTTAKLNITAAAIAATVPFDAPNVTSGNYTPTATAVTNVAVISAGIARWMRVGNDVTVSGNGTVDPTAASVATSFRLSLPIASGFSSFHQLGGVAAIATTAPAPYMPVRINADSTTDEALFTYNTDAGTTGLANFSYTYTYEII